MADTNILDAESLINGSVVNPPENINIERPELLTNINTQLDNAKAQALTIQEGLATKLAEEKASKEKLDATTNLDVAKEEQKTWLEKILAGDDKTKADVRAEEETATGLTDKETKLSEQTAKVLATQDRMTALESRRDAAIERAEGKAVVQYAIDLEIDDINRKFDKQQADLATTLSSQAAMASFLQGDVEAAQTHITDAINDAMYDYDQEVKRYERVYDYYGSWVDSLTTDQRTTLDRAYQESQDAKDNARADLEYKQGLWTRAAEQGVNIPFEDLKNMTTEEATKLYAEKVSAMVTTEKEQENGVAKTLTDNQIRAQIVLDVEELGGKMDETSYNRLKAEITLNENILNQDRALFILDEQFGKAGGKTFEQWKGEDATQANIKTPALKPSIFSGETEEGFINIGGKKFETTESIVAKQALEDTERKKVQELLAGSPLTRKSQFIYSPENLKITPLYK